MIYWWTISAQRGKFKGKHVRKDALRKQKQASWDVIKGAPRGVGFDGRDGGGGNSPGYCTEGGRPQHHHRGGGPRRRNPADQRDLPNHGIALQLYESGAR
ncbi:hypothetical protein GOP47_0029725 [Adiantum capillus-veneris]|nr:hypothetical protein GOP47_0029725 [Adiantum capillus-veneris]